VHVGLPIEEEEQSLKLATGVKS